VEEEERARYEGRVSFFPLRNFIRTRSDLSFRFPSFPFEVVLPFPTTTTTAIGFFFDEVRSTSQSSQRRRRRTGRPS